MRFVNKAFLAVASVCGLASTGMTAAPDIINPVKTTPYGKGHSISLPRISRAKSGTRGGRLSGRIGGNQRQLRKDRGRYNAAGMKNAYK
jgi:hypothetical protein